MVRIMIVDDQEMIRLGLRGILSAQNEIEVVAEASDGLRALSLLETHEVDVVLMDLRMPGIDGVETTRRIREKFSSEQLRILVFTTFDNDENVFAALKAGANGFLSKGASPAELVAGIQDVATGGGALSATASAALIGHVAQGPVRTAQPGQTLQL
ncbi:response regulator transcription factor [Glutamicibacter sp. JC586]|uniref:response regulator n=1 Tax=Glutamicibacter sp. JC586 TaxID=2590552 RepID=UPI00135861F6|nr:response regulator transcription factor [Glutamicibacter sp. JC586]